MREEKNGGEKKAESLRAIINWRKAGKKTRGIARIRDL